MGGWVSAWAGDGLGIEVVVTRLHVYSKGCVATSPSI